jgi:hypothetical protein
MNTIIKAAAALVAGAALILTLAGPAGATSFKTVRQQLSAIQADAGAVSAANRANDEQGVYTACGSFGNDAAIAQTATRPKGYSKVAWRSYQRGLSSYVDAAAACQAQDWPTTTEKMATGTSLIRAATRASRG